MVKGCLYIVRDGAVKLTLPGPSVTIRSDGTIWFQGMPVLGIQDPEIKKRVAADIKRKEYGNIPPDVWTRLGDNPSGLWAGDDEAWGKHPAKAAEEKKRAEAAAEAKKIVTIYLSSRGWGDYSPVEWTGDITRNDRDIVTECRQRLEAGHDVDTQNQTDDEILSKIIQARKVWAEPEKEYKEPIHGHGYCYSCESYCYGDCGNYQPSPRYGQREKYKEVMREQNYGVND